MSGNLEDPFDLRRFVDAQQDSYASALAEIARGAKRGHWMWFVFPQIVGLGGSAMAQRFAIGSLEEARAYLRHPLLGARYGACVAALQDLPETSPERVFGPVDSLKLRSSLTLFARAEPRPLFTAALARWFGAPDEATLRILAAER